MFYACLPKSKASRVKRRNEDNKRKITSKNGKKGEDKIVYLLFLGVACLGGSQESESTNTSESS